MDTRIQKILPSPRILIRLIFAALILLVYLQILDVLSTIRFVKLYGIEMEENELARTLFSDYHVAGLWLHKLLFIPFAAAPTIILFELAKRHICNKNNYILISSFLLFFLCAYTYLTIQFLIVVIGNFVGR